MESLRSPTQISSFVILVDNLSVTCEGISFTYNISISPTTLNGERVRIKARLVTKFLEVTALCKRCKLEVVVCNRARYTLPAAINNNTYITFSPIQLKHSRIREHTRTEMRHACLNVRQKLQPRKSEKTKSSLTGKLKVAVIFLGQVNCPFKHLLSQIG